MFVVNKKVFDKCLLWTYIVDDGQKERRTNMEDKKIETRNADVQNEAKAITAAGPEKKSMITMLARAYMEGLKAGATMEKETAEAV